MRKLGRTAGICGAVVILSALGTGCADNESEIYIRNVVAPDESCVYTPAEDGVSFLAGLLDGAVRFEYSAAILIGNQTVARGDADSLRTETSAVNIYEYDVRVLNSEGAVYAGAAFTAPTAGFINAKVGDEDGFGIASVVLIDGATGQALGLAAGAAPQQVVSEVVVRGRTLGGNEVESRPFTFPITVCAGCTVIFPIGVATADSACGVDPEEAPEGLGCTPGQDGSGVGCYQCRQSNPAVCDPPL
jgi:hypothetical protein